MKVLWQSRQDIHKYLTIIRQRLSEFIRQYSVSLRGIIVLV